MVHVAGTNGKGSVIAFMRACLEAAGYGVHAYTSPHLVRFNERIRVAGEVIADGPLGELLEECEDANSGDPITFFEITTAAALLAFSRRAADVVLLETGLGGRLDATNMVKRPALTVITPVSEDHHQFLGETLAEIAAEKAGILKPGVACVIAAQEAEALEAIETRAEEVGAPLFAAAGNHHPLVRGLPAPALVGAHQVDNAGLAVACLDRLAGFRVSDDNIASGLQHAQWPGRLQRLSCGPLVEALPSGWELWIDGGHNPAAARVLAAQARRWRDKPLHLVLGMMEGKDVPAFLRPLAGAAASLRTVAVPGEEGSRDADELAKAGAALGINSTSADGVAGAIKDMAGGAPDGARVLVCGSLYLAGAVLRDNG